MSVSLCPSCGAKMRRSRRTRLERLLYAAAYRCEACNLRVRESFLSRFRTARFVSCPKCGGHDVTALSKRDRIDGFNRHPLRLFQGMLGARLYHCSLCRLQFYDLRSRGHTQSGPVSAT